MIKERATPFLLWLVALANCLAIAVVCYLWIDRPVADYINTLPRQGALVDWTARVLGSLKFVAAAALLCIIVTWVLVRAGKPLSQWMRTPLLASWAALGSLALVVILKHAIGRSQVYPPWIERREYGLYPFNLGTDYAAFPSATMAFAGAILAVTWLRHPLLRVPCTILTIVVAAAILLTNGHWVGDILVGAYIGGTAGWVVVTRPERLARYLPSA